MNKILFVSIASTLVSLISMIHPMPEFGAQQQQPIIIPPPAAMPTPAPTSSTPTPEAMPTPSPTATTPAPEQAPAPMLVPTEALPAPTPPVAEQSIAVLAPISEAIPPASTEVLPEPVQAQAPEQAPPSPMPAPSIQEAAPMPAPAAQPQALNAQEVSQLNDYLNTILTTKDELKKLLTRIDDEVGKAKTAAAQTRKRSMEILNQHNDDEAKKIINEIIAASDNLKKTYDDLNNSVNTTFQSGVAKIQTTISTMQETIKQLKSKGVALQASQPEEATHKNDSKTESPKNWLITDKSSSQKAEDKTVIHYIFNRIADIISEIARLTYATYQGAKAAWFTQETKPKVDDNKSIPATLPAATPPPSAMPTT